LWFESELSRSSCSAQQPPTKQLPKQNVRSASCDETLYEKYPQHEATTKNPIALISNEIRAVEIFTQVLSHLCVCLCSTHTDAQLSQLLMSTQTTRTPYYYTSVSIQSRSYQNASDRQTSIRITPISTDIRAVELFTRLPSHLRF
jgi:hypothetical protein